MYLGEGEELVLYPIPGGSTAFGHCFRQMTFESMKRAGLTAWKKRLGVLTSSRSEQIHKALDSIRSWDDITYFHPMEVNAESWGTRGVVMLGDSIFGMSPNLAQGANLSLDAAVCLAQLIHENLGKENPASIIEQFEKLFRPKLESSHKLAAANSKLLTTYGRRSIWLRRYFLRILNGSDSMKEKFVAVATGREKSLSNTQSLLFWVAVHLLR